MFRGAVVAIAVFLIDLVGKGNDIGNEPVGGHAGTDGLD